MESMNRFYKLKNDYDEQFYDKYVSKIVVSNLLSKREKKAAFAALPKPKCINCKRNVSTIFSVKYDKENDSHIYLAKCGDIMSPCPLNINIVMPNTKQYDDLLSSEQISNSKTQIIKAKNDLLFGYLPEKEAFEIFENLSANLKDDIETRDFFIEEYMKVYDKPNDLEKQKIDFEMNIRELKDVMNEFLETKNIQLIHSAVNMYIHNIAPQAREIRELTYAYNNVEYIDNNYVLIQKKNTLDQLELTGGNILVKSFIVGMKNPTLKPVKNKGNTSLKTNVKPVKNKTKKLKPILVIQEEPEEEQALAEVDTKEQQEQEVEEEEQEN